jgi:hypothetical protein
MIDIIKDLDRADYVMFHDGFHSDDLARRAAAEIIGLRDRLKKAETPPQVDADALIRELVAALGEIEAAPAWGAPDRWEPTPFEVRQLARDILAKAKAEGFEP